ncbi:MAG: adenylyltransferase/cytidyltransferase family protein [Ignavibacteriae bacterium]|nr:adenylyltransferase/cytidyltransferase family protein [Ignavibacteriota bacterium]
MKKKVFVSGCFDTLHSGHVAFFEEAAKYGDLYVGIGSDKTIYNLKGRKTIYNENERLYMVKSLKVVTDAWINNGEGIIDFDTDILQLNPDILFVNEDGHSIEKENFCRKHGFEYIVSKRIPHQNLPVRSTTSIRKVCNIPYRIDLAGGWLDQPFVSKFYPGSVITISIEPEYEFNHRSGMATSTRNRAVDLWEYEIPKGNKEQLAKILFCYENPPGEQYISGSQDAIGIVIPGLNKLEYKSNDYWPHKITSEQNIEILSWLEEHIRLISLKPREQNFNVFENTDINFENAKALSVAADKLWIAALDMNTEIFGKAFTESFNAQIKMFPNMIIPEVLEGIEKIKDKAYGWKLSGAGGGGYIVAFVKDEIPNSLKIKIRKEIF